MNRVPGMQPPSLEQMIEEGLSRIRPWLILAAALGSIATWLATLLLIARPDILLYDVALNVVSATILLIAVVWLVVGRGPMRRFLIILLSIEILIATIRMVAALILAYPEASLNEALPPLSPWLPLLFVAAFLLLPAREALYLSCAPVAVLMIATGAFMLRNFGHYGESFEMLNIVQQYIFMHPLLVLFLYLISRVAQRQRELMAEAYAREAREGDELEHDDWIDGMSRPGMLHLLGQALVNLKSRNSAVLISCHLRSCGKLLDERGERVVRKRVRALAEGLLRHLGPDASVGRLDSAHLMLLVPQQALQAESPEAVVEKFRSYAAGGYPDLDAEFSAMFLEPGMTVEIAMQALELDAVAPGK